MLFKLLIVSAFVVDNFSDKYGPQPSRETVLHPPTSGKAVLKDP
jgi:hypothetical protein